MTVLNICFYFTIFFNSFFIAFSRKNFFLFVELYFNPLRTKFFFFVVFRDTTYRLIGATLIGNFFDDPFLK